MKIKTFNEFLTAKEISEEAFAELSTDKKTELSREYNAELKSNLSELNEKVESAATAEALEVAKKELKEAQDRFNEGFDQQMKSINESLKQHGLAMKKLLQGTGVSSSENLGVIGQAKAAIAENADKLKSLLEGTKSEAQENRFSFDLKGISLKDITLSGSVTGEVPQAMRLPGVNNLATRQIRLLDVIARGTTMKNLIEWVYEATETGNVGGTAEGAVKNQVDITWVVDDERVKKRTGFIKATTEALTDVEWMATQINNNLTKRLLKDVEEQVHSGDNVGQNLNGLKTVASAFNGAAFAGTVENANAIDVLLVAMDNIMVADQPMPDFITMYPSDVTALKLIKVSSTDKRYVDRLTMVAGQLMLDGVPIIATTLETQDEYLIGNGSLATLYDKGEIRIDVGLDGNDFTENKRTILAEWRGALVVETNDRPAFVTGTFSVDQAVLETP